MGHSRIKSRQSRINIKQRRSRRKISRRKHSRSKRKHSRSKRRRRHNSRRKHSQSKRRRRPNSMRKHTKNKSTPVTKLTRRRFYGRNELSGGAAGEVEEKAILRFYMWILHHPVTVSDAIKRANSSGGIHPHHPRRGLVTRIAKSHTIIDLLLYCRDAVLNKADTKMSEWAEEKTASPYTTWHFNKLLITKMMDESEKKRGTDSRGDQQTHPEYWLLPDYISGDDSEQYGFEVSTGTFYGAAVAKCIQGWYLAQKFLLEGKRTPYKMSLLYSYNSAGDFMENANKGDPADGYSIRGWTEKRYDLSKKEHNMIVIRPGKLSEGKWTSSDNLYKKESLRAGENNEMLFSKTRYKTDEYATAGMTTEFVSMNTIWKNMALWVNWYNRHAGEHPKTVKDFLKARPPAGTSPTSFLEDAKKLWGLPLVQYPHQILSNLEAVINEEKPDINAYEVNNPYHPRHETDDPDDPDNTMYILVPEEEEVDGSHTKLEIFDIEGVEVTAAPLDISKFEYPDIGIGGEDLDAILNSLVMCYELLNNFSDIHKYQSAVLSNGVNKEWLKIEKVKQAYTHLPKLLKHKGDMLQIEDEMIKIIKKKIIASVDHSIRVASKELDDDGAALSEGAIRKLTSEIKVLSERKLGSEALITESMVTADDDTAGDAMQVWRVEKWTDRTVMADEIITSSIVEVTTKYQTTGSEQPRARLFEPTIKIIAELWKDREDMQDFAQDKATHAEDYRDAYKDLKGVLEDYYQDWEKIKLGASVLINEVAHAQTPELQDLAKRGYE